MTVDNPYYQDDWVTVYHGDCLEIDEWLKADVLVTDPPYGIAFRSNMRTASEKFNTIAGDASPAARDAALATWEAAGWAADLPKPRPAAVFGTWRAPRPAHVGNVLIWDKRGAGPGMGDLTTAFGTSHEEIYLIGSWPKRGTRRGSVIATQSSPSELTSRIGHPTPKPVGLMEQLVAVSAGVVADPFAGSGSTLVAARNLGRKAIGVELEEKYCEIIAKRLDQMCLDFSREGN